MERLNRFGFENGANPAAVYRTLRKLEKDSFVESTWETTGSGPARRSYTLTDDGADLLQAWVVRLGDHVRHIEEFLVGFRSLSNGGKRNV